MLRGGYEGLLVAFLGELDDDQAEVVARMRQRAAGAVAFVIDGRDDGEAAEPGMRMLREAGWTTVLVRPGDELAGLWRQADRHHHPHTADVKGSTT